jgi:hypothetical protein
MRQALPAHAGARADHTAGNANARGYARTD